MIPFLDLKRQYENIKEEIDSAILGVVACGKFILGENVAGLEDEIARFSAVKFGVGVASGTDALLLSLRVCGVGEGDMEVLSLPIFPEITTDEQEEVLKTIKGIF